MAHLFPGDHDEHGAVITTGLCETERGTRFLARDLFLAKDGVDYVPGKHGYRALTADFVARVSDHCAREKLCYFAVHCHGGRDEVSFSPDDLNSHERGYPALLDIVDGGPVGALVFAQNAVAGSIWTRDGIFPLARMTVADQNVQRLYSAPLRAFSTIDPVYDRQARIFGAAGQHHLAAAKIGIIGLGGAGSLVNEWLAHLGAGEIVAIDPEKLEPSNQSRVVGATHRDAQTRLSKSTFGWIRKLGRRLAKYKVHVAERVARRANPKVSYRAIVGDIVDSAVATTLKDADFLFLCADSAQSRLVFNALVHQYQIPGVQVGSKVSVDQATGSVGDIFAVARPVAPYSGGGCLLCNGLISPDRLQMEALNPEERKRQAYVDEPEVPAPSVIMLNTVACATAANEFLLGFFGLLDGSRPKGYSMQFGRTRESLNVECRAEATCMHCSVLPGSVFARGDRAPLPCR